jgi:hypothetical protein
MDVMTELARLVSGKPQRTPVQPEAEISGGLGIVESVTEDGFVNVTFNGSTFPVNATQEFSPVVGASVLVHFVGTQGWALGTGNPVPPQPTPPTTPTESSAFPNLSGVGPPISGGAFGEWYWDTGANNAPWDPRLPSSSGLWTFIAALEAYGDFTGEWMQLGGSTLDAAHPGLYALLFDSGFSAAMTLTGLQTGGLVLQAHPDGTGATVNVIDGIQMLSPTYIEALAPTVYIGESDGAVGLYGATPAVQQTVTGSRGGNAALASLLTALATMGLVVDSST